MPQPYGQAVLTDRGEELLAKSSAGQCMIEYVCMAIGDGRYSTEEKQRAELKKRAELKGERNRYAFSNAILENNAVRLTALLTNQNPVTFEGLVSEGYYINEIGIYAKEKGTENDTAILYSICLTASDTGMGDYMPVYEGNNRAEITQDYLLYIGDNTNITVNRIGAVALAEDVKECRDELIKHMSNKSNPHEVTKAQVGLGAADNTSDQDKPVSTAQRTAIDEMGQQAAESLTVHTGNTSNPHRVTKAQIGLGNVDNTADTSKPVSTAQRTAIDATYQQATGYTDQKIAELINGAPSTLDTLGEIAKAMQDNADVVNALDAAIGSKADQSELDRHTGNNTIHITSTERTNWNDANSKKHSHSNKSVLDAITDTIVSGWNSAVTHISDAIKHITASERKKWNNGSANYGSCSTAAATAAKTVACTGFELATGAEITVRFTTTNTAANPTLNVNSTGAKPIYYRGSAIAAGYLAANRTYTFRYNGTQWDLVGDINTNTIYSNMTAATASAAGKAGLVPAPAAGAQAKYLRGDGTFENVDDHAATFTSGDAFSPTGWADIGTVVSGEKHSSLWCKFSLAVKNLRYLWKLVGTTDISGIGDGTLTGVINSLNSNLMNTVLYVPPMTNTKTLNIVCTRADYDSLSYFVYLYAGGRITNILVINGATNLGTTVLTDVGINYGYVKLYENTDLAVRQVLSIKEDNTVRVKIQMANVRNDYRAIVKPISRTAVNGNAKYSADWSTV